MAVLYTRKGATKKTLSVYFLVFQRTISNDDVGVARKGHRVVFHEIRRGAGFKPGHFVEEK